MKDFSVSKFFYKIRGCAILSVAYAHSASFSNVVLDDLCSLLGIIGVPLFLIASGYYFRKQTWHEFITSKFKNIICPWIIWGSVAFSVSIIALGGEISFISYLNYILGHGTWLYYVPLYLITTALFNLHSSGVFIKLSLLISFVSCIFSYYNIYDFVYLTPYQNPLNWIGFYGLGILLKTKPLNKWAKCRSTTILLLSLLIVMLSFILVFLKMKICYWNPICFVFEMLSIFLVANICSRYNNNSIIDSFGKYSFLIYFLHMQFGIFATNRIFSLVELPDLILFCLKPIVVIVITYAYVRIIIYLVRLLGLQKINRYLGIPI